MAPLEKMTPAPDSRTSAPTRGRSFGMGGLMLVCGLLLVLAIFGFGGSAGTQNTRDWLPLLFLLPCVVMMFFCMRGMGNKNGNDRSSTDDGKN